MGILTPPALTGQEQGHLSPESPAESNGQNGHAARSSLADFLSRDISSLPVHEVRLSDIFPSPENDLLYDPPTDEQIDAFAEDFRRNGQLDPGVISEDHDLISGHRRHLGLDRAGFDTMRVRVIPGLFRRDLTRDEWLQVLVKFNGHQRIKSRDEQTREELVQISAEDAHVNLVSQRAERSKIWTPTMEIPDHKPRKQISDVKREFLAAVLQVIRDLADFLPISVRTIHYQLLNLRPVMNTRKPRDRYANTSACYKRTDDLTVRARLEGLIDFDAIADETRPLEFWPLRKTVGEFIGEEVRSFGRCYWRDLLQSQPNFPVLVVEKNTLRSIAEPIARRFCIPYGSARGFISIPPRVEILRHFKASGKDKLVLLVVSDHDPDGVMIAESLARSLAYDFPDELDNPNRVVAKKIALTSEQAATYELPTALKAKETSPNYKAFVQKFGTKAYEVEALRPDVLQKILVAEIESILDVDAFNREVDEEKKDAARLELVKRRLITAASGIGYVMPPDPRDTGNK